MGAVSKDRREARVVRDPEQVWRSGFELYDAGMAAVEARRPPGAVREQSARLRALAATASPAMAAELRQLAVALDAELEAGAWTPLAEAEELVGGLWAADARATPEETVRREEQALERLATLRQADPGHARPLEVLTEWVRLRRLHQGPDGAPPGVIPAP